MAAAPRAAHTGAATCGKRKRIYRGGFIHMWIENGLGPEEMDRAQKIPLTPLHLAGAHLSLLQAIDMVTQELVIPLVDQRKPLSDRATAFVVLFYRMVGLAKSTIELNSVTHQQTLTTMERLAIELLFYMKLLHENVFLDGVERFYTFAAVQKLKAANRTVEFFRLNRALDTDPPKAEVHRQFVALHGARIEASARRLWPAPAGKTPRVDHWSGCGVPDRAKKFGKEMELLVVEGYDMRNFSAHTGTAGILNIERSGFEAMCGFAVTNIAKCVLDGLKILNVELQFRNDVDVMDQILESLDEVPAWAVADQMLMSQGEPQRFRWHSGEPPTSSGGPIISV